MNDPVDVLALNTLSTLYNMINEDSKMVPMIQIFNCSIHPSLVLGRIGVFKFHVIHTWPVSVVNA